MKRVVMLGAGPLQLPAIMALKELGCEVLCVDYDPVAVGFEYADGHEIISTLDVEAVFEFAARRAADYVITSTSDAPVRVAAAVSERLGLPTGISSENAICATQKDAMRRRLAQFDIPMPEFFICNDIVEFERALDHFGYCCIAKPADSAASRGVRLITPDDRTSDVKNLFEGFLSFSRKGTVMVEERVRGREVSVEAMTVHGKTEILSITDKITTEPPYFVELGHVEPTSHTSDVVSEIERVVRKVIDAIGIETGPSHTEIMVTPDGPRVIETAARLGGDYITSKLVPLSTGVDLVKGSVASAVGIDYDFSRKIDRGSAIRFLTADAPGVISSIRVPDCVSAMPGVEEVVLYLGDGDKIDSPHSSNDRIGHVICTGQDASEALDRANRVLDMVGIELV